MKGPILHGPRLTLRPIELADAPQYVRWFKDKKVVRYLALQTGFTLQEERKHIRSMLKKKNQFNLSILNEKGKHIGASGTTFFPKDKKASVGIVIGDKKEWGKGYATEVMKLVAEYVIRKLKYNRFELILSMDNKQALKAYKKAGFKFEGIKRQVRWNLVTKKFEDEGSMSILKKEWLKINKTK